MQPSASQVASGNIAPMIKGPEKATKEVMVLGTVVLFLAGLLAAAWYYGQASDQTTATPATIVNQTGASSTHSAQVTAPVLSTPEIVHADIYFEVGRKGLSDEGKAQLTAQADMLKQHQDYGVLIQGYTDQQGSASYNMQLGMKRAETVKAELVNAGIAEHRIKTVSLGEAGLLCVDTSDTCRQMNRRVHLEVRKVGQEHMALPVIPTTPSDLFETNIAPSSATGEGGTTGESFAPAWSDPTLIPEPTKGK